MFYILARPFAFILVRHDHLRTAMIAGSIVCASIATLALFVVDPTRKIFGSGSFIQAILPVFSSLPGFFIAALAAVATFNRPELDVEMPDPAPQLKLMTQGKKGFVKLTTRMFLSFLFAYLTSVAFLGIAVLIAGDLLAPGISRLISDEKAHLIIKVIFVLTALLITFNIVITTLVGMYFLAERIHRGKV
ncbi:hypothetical protein [Novosphingobium sp.]|uniref:hypothetical protein n=1 Tax=Novosphingobium sp. TaxID=1874826 RepID=UPI00286BAA49|nr:hypothetical protein [Novosphingobium sp.]